MLVYKELIMAWNDLSDSEKDALRSRTSQNCNKMRNMAEQMLNNEDAPSLSKGIAGLCSRFADKLENQMRKRR